MAVYGLFYGGGSYSFFMEDRDVEVWNTIADAKESLRARYNGWDRVHYALEDESNGVVFPAVDAGACILILEVKRGRHKKGYAPSAHVNAIGDLTLRFKKDGSFRSVRLERF